MGIPLSVVSDEPWALITCLRRSRDHRSETGPAKRTRYNPRPIRSIHLFRIARTMSLFRSTRPILRHVPKVPRRAPCARGYGSARTLPRAGLWMGTAAAVAVRRSFLVQW